MSAPTTTQLFDLSGRKFLVVGGARTLGLDMALALAEAGAEGVVTSRSRDSAAAAYVTGHNLVVDGGFSCWK